MLQESEPRQALDDRLRVQPTASQQRVPHYRDRRRRVHLQIRAPVLSDGTAVARLELFTPQADVRHNDYDGAARPLLLSPRRFVPKGILYGI